jgi:hypothetical protein
LLTLCSAVALAAIAGCREVSAEDREPTLLAPAVNLSNAQADSIRLTYLCGNRWRVRNPIADTATVTFDVYGTTERGTIVLPPRPVGQPHSEITFVTVNRGTTRLFYRTRLVQTKAHGGSTCSSGTVPAVPPDTFPTRLLLDTLLLRTEGNLRYHPQLMMVAFKEGTPQATRAAAIASIGGLVVGGQRYAADDMGDDGWYLVRVPTATTLELLNLAIVALRARPEIESVTVVGPPDNEAQFTRPFDGVGFRSWFVQRDSTTGPSGALQSVGAPLAWSCSVGDPSVRVGVLDEGLFPAERTTAAFSVTAVRTCPATVHDLSASGHEESMIRPCARSARSPWSDPLDPHAGTV